MHIQKYIDKINKRYKLGNATEHSYRGDLQQLIESMVPSVHATNEAQRQSCGAPDYVITQNGIPLGFIETKDIGDKDLQGTKANKEQFARYKEALDNIIFTDYLDFYLYRDGQLTAQVAIGELAGKGIKALPQNFACFTELIQDFCAHSWQTITNSKKLARLMAAKAHLLFQVIEKALINDEENNRASNTAKGDNKTLQSQMTAFRQVLIHDITAKQFADVYAQTIAYGMFAARSRDPSLNSFSREQVYKLIPKSNPFLKKLFGYIAGLELDERITWIVDDLAKIFLACNVQEMLAAYGKATQTQDPILHFYEDFLSEYDPKLRKSRGVWYTPLPIVNFIVHATDDILKSEFALSQGLADTSKTTIKVDVQGNMVKHETHKVQILDPCTGTGTFLAQIIKYIYQGFADQQGVWSEYVQSHLLPRLNGFEILMASYAMAHLKLDLLLNETGFKPAANYSNQRFRVFLTNSLEEYHPDTDTLFASWLSDEANEANYIKRDTPVMCVLGNPPYAVSSVNRGKWIQDLIADYKKDLYEKKLNLDDDYIKFIRYGQHYIDKNGSGILAYISNNSFIDGITHRQMRRHLLDSFDKIYILDLHGSSKKKETAPDGSKDENVFDIQQGVSINIFIKSGKKKKKTLAKVWHADLYGSRSHKYELLNTLTLKKIKFKRLACKEPYYFFVPKDFALEGKYKEGFKIDDLFHLYSAGIETQKDKIAVHFSKESLQQVYRDFTENTPEDIKKQYPHIKDSRDWTVKAAKEDLQEHGSKAFQSIVYRPFDERFSYMSGRSKGFVAYPRFNVTQHLQKENLSLLTCKRQTSFDFQHVFIASKASERCTVSLQTGEVSYIFPLYLYPEADEAQTNFTDPSEQSKVGESKDGRIPNLNPAILTQIAEGLGFSFSKEKPTPYSDIQSKIFAPIDLLDYIYAVLHSPSYREKYNEFLKIDFPRVPYPKDPQIFWQLVELGGELREIHLLTNPLVEDFRSRYPIDGDNMPDKPHYKDGKVYINEHQYFENVPQAAWEFYIGGYQPAQKWLKDRRGRKLEYSDILHYQKIIAALSQTDRLMQEIDKLEL